MNREFVYHHSPSRQASIWSRAGDIVSKWMWGALCCGIPGVPCVYCTCCEKVDDSILESRPRMTQATATGSERMSRPRRPHAPPGSRKSTPEMLSAVRCALNQLQGEPAPESHEKPDLDHTQPGKTEPG